MACHVITANTHATVRIVRRSVARAVYAVVRRAIVIGSIANVVTAIAVIPTAAAVTAIPSVVYTDITATITANALRTRIIEIKHMLLSFLRI